MTTPHGPTSGRLRLRTALRTAREATRLTQQQVADAMDWSLSKIIRIEKGTVSVSTNDVRALLQLYEVRDERQVADLVELARAARKKAWWTAYKNEVPAHFGELIGLEAEASAHKYFQPIAVPGLLQTRAYARAVLSNIAPGQLTPEQIDTRVEIRMTRQREVLGQTNPPRLEIVLDEAVLRRVADGPEVMREQLLHLVEVGASPNVVIQVLPFVAGVNTVEGAFMILQFPDPGDNDVVYIESALTGHVLDRPDDIGPYRQAFERLQETSLKPDESLAMVAAVAAELRSSTA
jgi:transcriptional regulator with XRE-family HTH domain